MKLFRFLQGAAGVLLVASTTMTAAAAPKAFSGEIVRIPTLTLPVGLVALMLGLLCIGAALVRPWWVSALLAPVVLAGVAYITYSALEFAQINISMLREGLVLAVFAALTAAVALPGRVVLGIAKR
jgi:hypothetical protein